MKKRFLPFSLLLVIMILGQSVIADQGGHYVPRTQPTMNAESFMGSLRANQNTGLVDPADMFKAMQAPTLRDGANDPLYWINMGPDNMGGQTTAVLYDNTKNASGNPNGVVYIGSKGGGVYKTYNNGITWHQVGDMNLMVSTMVQDKNGIIYVGTGDGGDNANQNGLSQQGYTNSFIGSGIYTIDARNDDAMQQIVTPTADEWLYVNELAFVNDILLAATSEGLRYSNDNGQNWRMAKYIDANNEVQHLEGNAAKVKVGVDNLIVASVDGKLYTGYDINKLVCRSGTGNQMQGDTLLPKAAGLYDIAVSPTNKGVVVAASIDGSGNHKGVFLSKNNGKNWTVILPAVGSNVGHSIYEGYGLYNNGLVVDPDNDGVIYVTGYNLWRLQEPSDATGYYLCQVMTTNTTISSSAYIHVGLHTMVFNPNDSNEFYIGTNGGVFKGNRDFTFYNCNRNYVTSRMFNVAYSGNDTRILAAGLDHGTVLIEGNENANTMGTGSWINPTGDNLGVFSDDSHAGPCAISNLNPNTFFVTYKAGGLKRTETAGEDWVSTNFTSSTTLNSGNGISSTSYRLPILLKEKYNDEGNPFTIWYHNHDSVSIPGGTEVTCISENCHYPFKYTLPHHLEAGDSIEVHDPISARMYMTYKDVLYVTLTPLNFAVESAWYKLSARQLVNYSGEPLCMGLSEDGDNLFVGFKDGKLFRISNLNTVVDATTGNYALSTSALNPDCAVETKAIEVEAIDGRCVTSVSVDPRDPNKVVFTCGNYGNDDYVFFSTNALSEEPTFVSVQGNLPKMPVYSSVIEMATGDVIIGTDRGIYRTKNIANGVWTADNQSMGEVPVMELKQQTLYREDRQVVNVTNEGNFVTVYPGVHNTGIIYAATYGRGVFRCENYKQHSGTGIPETPAVVETSVSLYPNPVQGEATVSFNVTGNTDVDFQVFDLMGRMVMSQNMGRFAEGAHEFRINTENLSTGTYILRLNQGGNSNCVKFMVY
ncbi:MAG: T9SS type A sorting domain-containing protein [Bacteroidales bacterium]|nr:T9SS type A sorting domain-containing protein [Bacteroidales bacterium]